MQIVQLRRRQRLLNTMLDGWRRACQQNLNNQNGPPPQALSDDDSDDDDDDDDVNIDDESTVEQIERPKILSKHKLNTKNRHRLAVPPPP